MTDQEAAAKITASANVLGAQPPDASSCKFFLPVQAAADHAGVALTDSILALMCTQNVVEDWVDAVPGWWFECRRL